MNTIVGCQKIKQKLNTSSDTCIQKWICKVYQAFVSILPIYFELVGLDVISRYGFQESSFRVKPGDNRYRPNLDLEAKLEEFLRFEERSGAPLVIAVVADVAGFRALRSKSNHGSLIIGKEKSFNTNRCMLEPDDILSAYPAVYIRTTIDHSFSGKMLGNRRNSGKRNNDYDHTLERNPCKGVDSRIEMNSWPYTSWNNIIPMLKNTFPLSSEGDSVEIHWSQVDSDTSVYTSPIHNAMWFVAMKKTNDDNRWNRRNDEERTRKEQQFFSDFPASLRLRGIFKSNLKINNDDEDSLLNELSINLIGDRLLDNGETSQLLESFKRIFGLRSQGNKHGVQFRKQNATISPEFLTYPSHYAFFLGIHLMDSLGDE
jgi:hypothetical protein